MSLPFTGSTILVTGVGREGQVGEAVARALTDRGAALVLVDRTAEQAEARAAALRARMGTEAAATAYGCDLTRPDAVDDLARRVAAAHGDRLRALVHVAGGFAASGAVDGSDVDVWHRQIAINLTSAYLATRAFLPLVRNGRGALVYFASEAVLPGARVGGLAAYAAAKSGVVALMRAVAQDEAAHGVRANALAPTAIRTAANVEAMGEGARYVEREAVADVVAYLCSEEARAVTGQVIGLA